MTSKEIRKKVNEFKKEYNLNDINYPSLSLVVEKLGYVLVNFSVTVNDEDVQTLLDELGLASYAKSQRGFTFANSDSRIIFINEDLSEKEQLIVLSHEIGHIVLGHFHKANVIGNDVQDEFEANEFSHHLINSNPNGFVHFTSLSKKTIAIIAGSAAALILIVIGGVVLVGNNNDNTAYENATQKVNSYEIIDGSLEGGNSESRSGLESSENLESGKSSESGENSQEEIVGGGNETSSNKSNSTIVANSQTTAKSTTAAKSTTSTNATTVPVDTTKKFRILDGNIYVTESEELRGYLLEDIYDNLKNRSNFNILCSEPTYDETSNGGEMKIYLSSGYSFTSEDQEVIRKLTSLAHEFSQASPAWTRDTYTAYVYSSSGSLVFQSTNGN